MFDAVDHEGRSLLSETLLQCLDLVRDIAAKLQPVDKKVYFGVLLLLVDRSGDLPVLQHVADTVRDWILPPRAEFVRLSNPELPPPPELSVKEKANFLLRMCRFEMLHHNHLVMRFQDPNVGAAGPGAGGGGGGGAGGSDSKHHQQQVMPLAHQFAVRHTHLDARNVEAFARRNWVKKNSELWRRLNQNQENADSLFGIDVQRRHLLRAQIFHSRRAKFPSLVGQYLEGAETDP
jgi:hypothetical protein